MIGKEPEVFTGDQDKVEEFMTSWSVYHGINKQTRVMNNPMCHDSDIEMDYFSFLLYFPSHPRSLFISSFVLNTDYLLFTHMH